MVAHDIWDVGEAFESHIFYCGFGRVGYAPDCGSGLRGFKSRRSPKFWLKFLEKIYSKQNFSKRDFSD